MTNAFPTFVIVLQLFSSSVTNDPATCEIKYKDGHVSVQHQVISTNWGIGVQVFQFEGKTIAIDKPFRFFMDVTTNVHTFPKVPALLSLEPPQPQIGLADTLEVKPIMQKLIQERDKQVYGQSNSTLSPSQIEPPK